MNKLVRKHLNGVDDEIASAKKALDGADFKLAVVHLDNAKAFVNLAAAETLRAKKKRAESKFMQNTNQRS